jgi:hypothetical protein
MAWGGKRVFWEVRRLLGGNRTGERLRLLAAAVDGLTTQTREYRKFV